LIAFDKDPEAVADATVLAAENSCFQIEAGSFTEMLNVAKREDLVGKVDGILMDLGVSSPQLDEAARGFSFMRDGPLDMRMDPSTEPSAQQWLAQVSERDLQSVLKRYGEERYAKRIAQAIIQSRADKKITTTKQLAEIIAKAHPNWEKGKHPATRSFQGIRIAVNGELEELERALAQVVALLKPGGRLVVISFHSLEDSIVKRFIQDQVKGDIYPEGLPVKASMLNPTLKKVGKTVKATEEELCQNPRARSAIMRVALRC
jgi:16S rRNA (cytosine1402-N4)-methyltransferase